MASEQPQGETWDTHSIGYTKGTSPAGEMDRIREAFARAAAAIQAWPDPAEAWKAASDLGDLARQLETEAAEFRGYLAAYMLDSNQLMIKELAAFLHMTPQRVSKMIIAAREKGTPVTQPMTLPPQPTVILGVITSDRGVLIAKRKDGIPPWTFLGGENLDGETRGGTLRRRIRDEAGLTVKSTHYIGSRIHPKTSRVMVYAHVEVEPGEAVLGDHDDLAELRWASIDETRELMPDMYGPIRQYLDEIQRME